MGRIEVPLRRRQLSGSRIALSEMVREAAPEERHRDFVMRDPYDMIFRPSSPYSSCTAIESGPSELAMPC
jgi:hypothetical protein